MNEKRPLLITLHLQNEGNPDEIRRQHAENALPPSLLRNKLREKAFVVESDPHVTDQSILGKISHMNNNLKIRISFCTFV